MGLKNRFQIAAGNTSDPPRAKNRVIGSLGDSRMNNAGKAGISENIGPLHWACVRARQRLCFWSSHNYSVGGYTTQQIIDNLLDTACNSYPGTFYVLCGTNDRTTMTAQQTITNINLIVSRLLAAGKEVIIEAEFPRGDSTFTNYRLSADQLKDHMLVHQHILSLSATPGVIVNDSFPNTMLKTSTTGDIQTGLTIDGLHQNARGAHQVGFKSLADKIIARYPDAPSVLPTSNSAPDVWLNANPMMDGTGGSPGTGGSGSMAASWGGSVGSTIGGITRVYSKTAEGYQKIAIGGTAASGSNPQLDLLRQTGLHTKSIGKKVYAVAEMELAAACSNITSLQLGIQITLADASNVYVWDGERYNDSGLMPTEAISGVWMTEPITVPAGATDVRLLVRAYGVSSAASTGEVTVKSCGLTYVQ